jgi:hypothetical protein
MSASPEQALLLACLHQSPQRLADLTLPAADSRQWDTLVEQAARQRVRPLVHRRLKALSAERDIPERTLQTLEQATRGTAMRNLRYQAEIAALARTLASDGIDLLLLKGAHLIAAIYESAALREMGDIDVLVRREHLARAADVVTSRGYRPLSALSVEGDAALAHHLPRFMKPDVASIEIHWSITMPTDPHAIDPAPLWSRAETLTVGGARLLGLSREDLLLHLCSHASYQHLFRFGLRPFCDLAALIARDAARLEWAVVIQRARDWRWDRGVFLTLSLARELVGAAAPDAVLDALRPSPFEAGVLSTARAHVFSDASADAVLPGIARLAGGDSPWSQLRYLRRRLGSPRVGRSWLHRAREMVARNALPAARLLMTRDPSVTAAASRTNALRRWLES